MTFSIEERIKNTEQKLSFLKRTLDEGLDNPNELISLEFSIEDTKKRLKYLKKMKNSETLKKEEDNRKEKEINLNQEEIDLFSPIDDSSKKIKYFQMKSLFLRPIIWNYIRYINLLKIEQRLIYKRIKEIKLIENREKRLEYWSKNPAIFKLYLESQKVHAEKYRKKINEHRDKITKFKNEKLMFQREKLERNFKKIFSDFNERQLKLKARYPELRERDDFSEKIKEYDLIDLKNEHIFIASEIREQSKILNPLKKELGRVESIIKHIKKQVRKTEQKDLFDKLEKVRKKPEN